MAQGKLLAICQYGGEFVTNIDGSMSYNGGEAHVIDIDRDMSLDDFKSEIANMFTCKHTNFSIKYYLPSNKRTLITVSNDKDLRRMVDFNANSTTTDVYILDNKVEKRTKRSIVAFSGTTTTVATVDTTTTMMEAKQQRVSDAWDNVISGVGQVFDSIKAFRDALHKYAIAKGFMYKFIKNDGLRVTAECTAEDCGWRIHASGRQKVAIKKMNDTHTCGGLVGKEGHRLANQRWVASVIKDKLRDSPDYKPREIAEDLHREYGLILNYSQAYRGKYLAKQELYDPQEEACNQLPGFCERIMETNPGSIATFTTTDESICRLFVSFHASLHGFEHGCRPLLFLDGISLKSNRYWKVLAATAVDGENGMFPVAFTVVESDTKENWLWFLGKLKSALSMSRSITFVSNRQNGLDDAVCQVFEDSYHGYCLSHLIEDFKAELDESWTEEVKDGMLNDLKRAACAYKLDEYNACIESIKNVSKEVAEWVLASKPECWSNAFFKGLRYNSMSSTVAESFDTWVTKVSTNEPSVVQMVDMIRCMIMEMIYSRRASSNAWVETLVPSMNQKLVEESIKARSLDVVGSTASVFEVRDTLSDSSVDVVNIETWECTCRKWQVTGLPCIHAIAALESGDGCVYNYCSKYFTTECYRLTYSMSINPIPDDGKTGSYYRLHRGPGRPKAKLFESPKMSKRPLHCSRCKSIGHNKLTCKAADS